MKSIPAEVQAAAEARSAARAARDWATADRLRAEIEAAGWRVVDRGVDFRLEPAYPPDVAAGGIVRYGRSEAVPSRLGLPAVGIATAIVVAEDPAGAARALAAILATVPAGTTVVAVADALATDDEAALEEIIASGGEAAELIRTSSRVGHATALNMGLRRAAGPVVVLVDPSIEPVGDIVTPLVRALHDPSVAIAGAFGLASDDLRHFEEVTAPGDVTAIEGSVMGFRRADAAERGPLDEHFRFHRHLDVWWSLVLRDEGPDRPSRRAVVASGLPVRRHGRAESTPAPERERLTKRNFYRVIDRFGRRRDLVMPAST